jgi:hypothetical protein
MALINRGRNQPVGSISRHHQNHQCKYFIEILTLAALIRYVALINSIDIK